MTLPRPWVLCPLWERQSKASAEGGQHSMTSSTLVDGDTLSTFRKTAEIPVRPLILSKGERVPLGRLSQDDPALRLAVSPDSPSTVLGTSGVWVGVEGSPGSMFRGVGLTQTHTWRSHDPMVAECI